ncbi:BA75_00232T0 [Komagataella pastoris]|uniref:BA75_00232T0 n=1 Tax=Komagataella pastoris TaxID=4922 RepID=A0A1B2J9G6_PICPA|nr:BA75_00232T0 [Komagataella pastoris]
MSIFTVSSTQNFFCPLPQLFQIGGTNQVSDDTVIAKTRLSKKLFTPNVTFNKYVVPKQKRNILSDDPCFNIEVDILQKVSYLQDITSSNSISLYDIENVNSSSVFEENAQNHHSLKSNNLEGREINMTSLDLDDIIPDVDFLFDDQGFASIHEDDKDNESSFVAADNVDLGLEFDVPKEQPENQGNSSLLNKESQTKGTVEKKLSKRHLVFDDTITVSVAEFNTWTSDYLRRMIPDNVTKTDAKLLKDANPFSTLLSQLSHSGKVTPDETLDAYVRNAASRRESTTSNELEYARNLSHSRHSSRTSLASFNLNENILDDMNLEESYEQPFNHDSYFEENDSFFHIPDFRMRIGNSSSSSSTISRRRPTSTLDGFNRHNIIDEALYEHSFDAEFTTHDSLYNYLDDKAPSNPRDERFYHFLRNKSSIVGQRKISPITNKVFSKVTFQELVSSNITEAACNKSIAASVFYGILTLATHNLATIDHEPLQGYEILEGKDITITLIVG